MLLGDTADVPAIQAAGQQQLLDGLGEHCSSEALQSRIDAGRNVEGASWTNDLSWVKGYESVLEPMQQLSAAFHQRYPTPRPSDPSYQQALLHLLLLETSCFRYWGQGTWTDYAREIHRRGQALLSP